MSQGDASLNADQSQMFTTLSMPTMQLFHHSSLRALYCACQQLELDQRERESETAVLVLQRGVAADSIARRTRNGGGGSCRPPASEQKRKGNKHITMQFLEEGGYFDAPIQVSLCLQCPHLPSGTSQSCPDTTLHQVPVLMSTPPTLYVMPTQHRSQTPKRIHE